MFGLAGQSQAVWILIFGDKLSNDFMQSGINVSVSYSNYLQLNSAKPLRSWAIGGFTDIKINKTWAISMEMTVKSPTGASGLENLYPHYYINDSLIKDQNLSIETTNFSVPFFVKYKTKYVNFGIGPQFIYAYKSTKKYSATTNTGEEITIKEKNKDLINDFDMGIASMVEFYLSPNQPNTSLRIGLEYYYGFLSPLKAYDNIHNSVFLIKVGIPIAGKKQISQN